MVGATPDLLASRLVSVAVGSIGAPKDKWESTRLHFVPFTPSDIATFVADTTERWLPIGLAAVILGLWQIGYRLTDIDAAFGN